MPSSDSSSDRRITVTLTREQAEHVLRKVLVDLEYGLGDNVVVDTRQDRDAIRSTLDSYERRIDELSAPGDEVTYTDHRDELEALADELMDSGADHVRDVTVGSKGKDHGELAGERRKELRKAETGATIYDQIVRAAGPAEVAA